ncbi:MAG: DUF6788 family protein [Thermodesulfovibrionales bacterium]|jgi:hypothetical protein
MKPRNSLSQKERSARSRATKLIHDSPFVVGSLVEMANTCGKPHCKCTRGEKHKSWCLAVRDQGKRKMLHVPHELENEVFEWVNTYRELRKHMETISHATVERIARFKKTEKE